MASGAAPCSVRSRSFVWDMNMLGCDVVCGAGGVGRRGVARADVLGYDTWLHRKFYRGCRCFWVVIGEPGAEWRRARCAGGYWDGAVRWSGLVFEG